MSRQASSGVFRQGYREESSYREVLPRPEMFYRDQRSVLALDPDPVPADLFFAARRLEDRYLSALSVMSRDPFERRGYRRSARKRVIATHPDYPERNYANIDAAAEQLGLVPCTVAIYANKQKTIDGWTYTYAPAAKGAAA